MSILQCKCLQHHCFSKILSEVQYNGLANIIILTLSHAVKAGTGPAFNIHLFISLIADVNCWYKPFIEENVASQEIVLYRTNHNYNFQVKNPCITH